MTKRNAWQMKRWQLRLWVRPMIIAVGLMVGGYFSYKFGLQPLLALLNS